MLKLGDVNMLNWGTEYFPKQPNVAAIFLNKGKPFKVGERLVQKQLAATLREISAKGPDVFYKGDIAERVVAASKANGGLLTMKDFADYTVEETKPVTCSYRGYQIISSPPPSSGGTIVCEIMNILSAYPMDKMEPHSAKTVHLMAEAMRRAYVDRNFSLGDPAFVNNPVGKLLSADHAAGSAPRSIRSRPRRRRRSDRRSRCTRTTRPRIIPSSTRTATRSRSPTPSTTISAPM